jgi:hypothetical protein
MARAEVRYRVLVLCLAVDAAVLLVSTALGIGSVVSRIAVLVSLLSAGWVAARLGRRR